MVERIVIDAVREYAGTARGRASREQRVREADEQLERAQAALVAAIRAFTGLEGETAAAERLAELRAARDLALDARADLARNGRARSSAPPTSTSSATRSSD